MKDTNAIEKALIAKIDTELKEVVGSFMESIEKLNKEVGFSSSFFDLKGPSVGTYGGVEKKKEITCVTLSEVERILFFMLKDNFGARMLNSKSKQLLAKLEIL